MKFYILATFFILFTSCKKEAATVEQCEDWAMLSFQGKPFEAKRLKDECSQLNLKYSKDVCQKALQKFIMSGNQIVVQKEFGDRIMGCFTSDDIKRFEKVNP